MKTSTAHALGALFDPQSIAVIGASNDVTKFGGRPIKYMIDGGFKGSLYPIHKVEKNISGLKAYPDLGSVGQKIDLVVLAIPAEAVVARVRECADAGVKAVIIFSSGFAEAGEAGLSLQREIEEICTATGLRVLGPNCIGLFNSKSRAFPSFASLFEQGWPEPGGIVFACQSGAVGAHLVVLAKERQLGIRAWVATGNESDVSVADCISYFATDPDTKVIVTYIEGVRDSARLLSSLALARENGKPVVMIKAGRSAVGAQAASSHTAALAGSDKVFDSVLKEYGVYRADSMEDMIDVAAAVVTGVIPASNRLAVFTLSGGVGILAADAAESAGLELAEMPDAAQKKLVQIMPFASGRNPIDVSAQIIRSLDKFSESLHMVADEGGYDSLLIFMSYAARLTAVAARVTEMLLEVRKRHPGKLLVLSAILEPADRLQLESAGCFVSVDPNRAINAIAALTFYGATRRASKLTRPHIRQHEALVPVAHAWTEREALEMLGRAGIPVTASLLVQDETQAAAAMRHFGAPVAIKVASADILHKSDVGGVKLNINDEVAAAEAFRFVIASARKNVPNAVIEGAIVQPMAKEGVDMILGVHRDPVFGPVVLVGLGGIFVEILQDTAVQVAPFDKATALRLIDGLKGRRMLDGARGSPPSDIEALAQALSELSGFASANAHLIESIDINPFRVFPRGEGAIALDAVVLSQQLAKSQEI